MAGLIFALILGSTSLEIENVSINEQQRKSTGYIIQIFYFGYWRVDGVDIILPSNP